MAHSCQMGVFPPVFPIELTAGFLHLLAIFAAQKSATKSGLEGPPGRGWKASVHWAQRLQMHTMFSDHVVPGTSGWAFTLDGCSSQINARKCNCTKHQQTNQIKKGENPLGEFNGLVVFNYSWKEGYTSMLFSTARLDMSGHCNIDLLAELAEKQAHRAHPSILRGVEEFPEYLVAYGPLKPSKKWGPRSHSHHLRTLHLSSLLVWSRTTSELPVKEKSAICLQIRDHLGIIG